MGSVERSTLRMVGMGGTRRDSRADELIDGLVREHGERVRALLRRRGVPEQEIEGVMQEANLKATVQFRQSPEVPDPPLKWLFRLTLNVWLSRRRKQARRSRYAVVGDEAERAEAPAPDPEKQAQLRQEARWLLHGLDENLQVVFFLYEIYRFKQREIAKLLGIPLNTVKSQLHRARQYVQQRAGSER